MTRLKGYARAWLIPRTHRRTARRQTDSTATYGPPATGTTDLDGCDRELHPRAPWRTHLSPHRGHRPLDSHIGTATGAIWAAGHCRRHGPVRLADLGAHEYQWPSSATRTGPVRSRDNWPARTSSSPTFANPTSTDSTHSWRHRVLGPEQHQVAVRSRPTPPGRRSRSTLTDPETEISDRSAGLGLAHPFGFTQPFTNQERWVGAQTARGGRVGRELGA